MKNFLTLAFTMLVNIAIFAQSPQAVCYQGVATDAAGIELQGRNISVKATLIQGTIGGPMVSQEVYEVSTDDFGLFTLEIGQGTAVVGVPAFEDIDWGQGPFFLRMEMDPSGGTDFIFLGTSQILSVPYALYSEKSDSAQNAINAQNAVNATNAIYADTATVAVNSLTALDDNDTSPDNEIQDLTYDAATGELSISNSTAPAVVLNSNDADADPANEIQELAYNAATGELSISNSTGPAIVLNSSDADADPLNEIQDLTYDASTGALSISNSTAPAIVLSSDDADADPANEIQDLVYNTTTGELSISNSTGPSVLIDNNDADADPANELQNLQYNATTGGLSLTGVTASEIIINTNDADADSLNEIQQLSLVNNVLTISGTQGNSIDFRTQLFGAPGASPDFPQGIVGEHLVLKTGTFTVPSNKTFYLTAGGNSVDFLTPTNSTVTHPTTPNMPVFGPNTSITNCRCTGMLVDYNSNVAPAVLDLTVSSDTYTVPTGFILFLKSGISNSMTGALKIDGDDMEFLRPNFTRGSRILSFPEGTNIQRPTNSDPGAFVLTGYLIATPN